MIRPRLFGPAAGFRPLAAVLLAAGLAPASALLLLPAAAGAQAEATTGVIRGTVRDPGGEPLAGAEVVIEHRDTGLRTTVRTNAGGTFARTLLPLGTYDVTASSPAGFGTDSRTGLELRVGETLVLSLGLRPLELEGITVVRERDTLLESEDVTSSQRFSETVVDALPSNGRNFIDFTLLVPGVSISQGPDGDELNISGQRGIFNNFIVDGADFNNAFFGEQRGGQRPAFTFNQDAIREIVVVNQGATAEFGRSAGGFVNVVTRSGTNDFGGTAHFFGQWDQIAASHPEERGGGEPEFGRGQFGITLGGPLVRDRAFFFLAYDQQGASETKQRQRRVQSEANLRALESFLQERWPGVFGDEFGPIRRTDDARALLAKLDVNLHERHQASLKYNYTWSEQVNGTFDVDSWGRSANGIERSRSHAVQASLRSLLGNSASNELRVQWAVEHRPRWYGGPLMPGAALPGPPQFRAPRRAPLPRHRHGLRRRVPHRTAVLPSDRSRIGRPDPDRRQRLLPVGRASLQGGRRVQPDHGGAAVHRVRQQPLHLRLGRRVHRVRDARERLRDLLGRIGEPRGHLSGGERGHGTGPHLPAVGDRGRRAGRPARGADDGDPRARALRPGHLAADRAPDAEPRRALGGRLAPRGLHRARGDVLRTLPRRSALPSDGTIPDDLDNVQPRLGLVWEADGGRTLLRLNAGAYAARIPGLVFAQYRTTNGAFQQILFRSSADAHVLGPVPQIETQIAASGLAPFLPDIHVADRNLELPRTWSFGAEATRSLSRFMTASLSWQHARTDHLFRFVNRNAEQLGAPWGLGTHPSGGGINTLTVGESTARSRYHGLTLGMRGEDEAGGFAFDMNYTLGFDRSDDDNERDPFTLRYADPRNLEAEWGWSDRDRRHQFNGYFVHSFANGLRVSQLFRLLTASPVSARCAEPDRRAAEPADRICPDGSVLERNTLRRDNDVFTWDLRVSREFELGRGLVLEPVLEIFNLTNEDNFLDTAHGSLLFNFDGTIQSGLGDTRRAQIGARMQF